MTGTLSKGVLGISKQVLFCWKKPRPKLNDIISVIFPGTNNKTLLSNMREENDRMFRPSIVFINKLLQCFLIYDT